MTQQSESAYSGEYFTTYGCKSFADAGNFLLMSVIRDSEQVHIAFSAFYVMFSQRI